jgi:hypothetical protein
MHLLDLRRRRRRRAGQKKNWIEKAEERWENGETEKLQLNM